MIKEISTPAGRMVIGTRKGRIVLIDFMNRAGGVERSVIRTGPDDKATDAWLVDRAEQQLSEYFNKERQVFDLPVELTGNDAEKKLWDVLASIPYGTVVTYKDVADRLGRQSAVRAVATAIGKNPLAIIIPCHRVVGSDGKLHGYSGGIEIKARLLMTEGSVIC